MTDTGVVTGTLHRLTDTTGAIRMRSHYATDPADLWEALTDTDRLARWIARFDEQPAVGVVAPAHFTSGWDGHIEVLVCEPNRRILVRGSDEDANPTEMEAILEEVDGGTLLVIEERGLPIENVHYHGAGWQVHVEDLGTVVAGGNPEPWEPRWRALLPEYENRERAAY